MNTTEFFLRWNGKYLDVDGVFGPQCVDVTKKYFLDVLGLPVFKGNAIDYWNKVVPGFKKIRNNPWNFPMPGDIIIWRNTPSNPFGHIAICNWSRLWDFSSFDQNYPIGYPCHYQYHNYKDVVGWLRPINN